MSSAHNTFYAAKCTESSFRQWGGIHQRDRGRTSALELAYRPKVLYEPVPGQKAWAPVPKFAPPTSKGPMGG